MPARTNEQSERLHGCYAPTHGLALDTLRLEPRARVPGRRAKRARSRPRAASSAPPSPRLDVRSPPSKRNSAWRSSRGSATRSSSRRPAWISMEHLRAMGDAATRVSMTAAGKSLSIDGTVCITASELIAAHVLPPIIGRMRKRPSGHRDRDRRLEHRTRPAASRGRHRGPQFHADAAGSGRQEDRRPETRASTQLRPTSSGSATRPRPRTCPTPSSSASTAPT